MKILLMTDIHGNLPALKKILATAGVNDKVVCLGDLAGYYPFVNEVIEIVSSLDHLICIKGNHDHVLINETLSTNSYSADLAIDFQRSIISEKNKNFLEALPETLKINVEGQTLFIFHGTPNDPLNGREPFWEKKRLHPGIYLFGHEHKPFLKMDRDQKWMVINPGSCGFPRDGDPRASFAILNTVDYQVNFYRVEYPIEIVVEKCKEVGLPERFWKSLKAGRWLSESKEER